MPYTFVVKAMFCIEKDGVLVYTSYLLIPQTHYNLIPLKKTCYPFYDTGR